MSKMGAILEGLSRPVREATIPKDIELKVTAKGTTYSTDDFFNADYAEDIISGLEDGKKLIDLVKGNLKNKSAKIEKGAGDKRFVLTDKDGGRYSVEVKFL